MKEVPLRRFITVVPYLTEPVSITRDGERLGMFYPDASRSTMDDTARKSIEKDQTKVERGQIRKGLGDLPGERKDAPTPEFRPVPKPGSKR